MKRLLTLIVIALSLKAGVVQSQTIPNNGFEQLNSDGSLSNWGNVYIFSAWFDTLGVSHSDSIVFDNQFYAPTYDAYSGNTALELRNAWNYTTNTGIAGAVASDEDTVFSSWGLLNLVPTYATISSPFEPFNFGFYYKYFPVYGDSAFAEIALWDSSGNQIAEGTLIISDSASNYTLAYVPINYTSIGSAAFYSFNVSTFYSSVPGSHEPNFGTRLLVDDIGFNFTSTGLNTIKKEAQFKIYPNPANEQFKIESRLTDEYNYSIHNIAGQVVLAGSIFSNLETISIATLNDGVYTIELNQGVVKEYHRFIVKK